MPKLADFDFSKCPKYQVNDKFKSCLYFDPTKDERACGFCTLPEYYHCIAHRGQLPLSHSSVQNFLTCHYLYYLQNIRGIQTVDSAKSSPLKCGALWDAVLGLHYGGKDKATGLPYDIPKLIEKLEISPRDVAKVRGLYRAYKLLDIQIEPEYELQSKISLSLPFNKVWGDGTPVEILITGYYDRKYPDSFVENKLSGRPDNYLDPWFIQSQVGTYFLADPSLSSCIMEIARTPDLKSTGKFKDESDEAYGERVYQDVLSRPSHYFLGYNAESHHYGKKFYRKEFNLEELQSRFIHILREYWEAREFDGWYKNDRACNNVLPGISCDMLPLCRYNNMSESMYKVREHLPEF